MAYMPPKSEKPYDASIIMMRIQQEILLRKCLCLNRNNA